MLTKPKINYRFIEIDDCSAELSANFNFTALAESLEGFFFLFFFFLNKL